VKPHNPNPQDQVTPPPMYESYKKTLEAALANHVKETLLPYKGRFDRGFEAPMDFTYEKKNYRLRMIVLFDHGLCARKQATLHRRVKKTAEWRQ
jgi:hypothetical protein